MLEIVHPSEVQTHPQANEVLLGLLLRKKKMRVWRASGVEGKGTGRLHAVRSRSFNTWVPGLAPSESLSSYRL